MMEKSKMDHENIYRKARSDAAKYNDRLKSREGAAELMNMSAGTLFDYEHDLSKTKDPANIVRMASLYRAPELLENFCKNECPIGAHHMTAEVKSIDRITVQTLSAICNIQEAKMTLLAITEDGVIDDSEKPKLEEVTQALERIEKLSRDLKLWMAKNMG